MPKALDLTGQVFDRLTVIQKSEFTTKRISKWECLCSCGERVHVSTNALRKGATKSCGCLRKEVTAAHATKHGLTGTRLHTTWKNMRQRCSNPNLPEWEYYGGKGISVCNDWLDSFQAFYDWAMTNGYSDELTIDRIDGNSDYAPSNCRWVTMKEQNNNRQKRSIWRKPK